VYQEVKEALNSFKSNALSQLSQFEDNEKLTQNYWESQRKPVPVHARDPPSSWSGTPAFSR